MTRIERNKLNAIGRSAFSCLRELVEVLEAADDQTDSEVYEAAREAIEHDPLSIEVRSDWREVGEPDSTPCEYRILLSTGGPATRIVGELDNAEPSSACLQVQDWGTPWTEVASDEETLLTYARVFYWGDS
jgi:hypothetical protein